MRATALSLCILSYDRKNDESRKKEDDYSSSYSYSDEGSDGSF